MKDCLTPAEKAQLATFFSDEISKEDFAKTMRKFIYISLMQHLKSNDIDYNDDLAESVYWLSLFLEIIAPSGLHE